MQIVGAIIFALALLHTFTAKYFEILANKHPLHAGLFHLQGEVEVVFGFWALVLILAMALVSGGNAAISYTESRQYTEPLFVFVVMVVAASRPMLEMVRSVLAAIARLLPLRNSLAQVWLGLAVVPLTGSFITEPAAMTLAALMLASQVFRHDVPEWLKYGAIGVLFVNVSIGGVLTSYAAPPVLMVAAKWQWDSLHMLSQFGWKASLAVALNASAISFLLRTHISDTAPLKAEEAAAVPALVSLIHLAFLAGVVAFAHHPVFFTGLFLFFLGYTQAYERHQSPLILKEGLLVGFFLAGLVVLGGLQQWWLQAVIAGLQPAELFLSAVGLTAITDNAALTYLGSLITGIPDESKYALLAGAVAGGGLTVIANAPNPAGAALLRRGFRDESIGALGLLLGAALPTVVAASFLYLLP